MIKYALAVSKHFIQTLSLNKRKSNSSKVYFTTMRFCSLCVYILYIFVLKIPF